MKKHYRDLDKLRSSRAKALRLKRSKFGNPRRGSSMVAVMIDRYQTQDREAAQRFAREQAEREYAASLFPAKEFEKLSDADMEKVREAAEAIFEMETPELVESIEADPAKLVRRELD